jgi:hypothetical protein
MAGFKKLTTLIKQKRKSIAVKVGVPITIELLAKQKLPIAVSLPKKKLEAKDEWGDWTYPVAFSDKNIFVTKVDTYGNKSYYLSYICGKTFTVKQTRVPHDFKVVILPDTVQYKHKDKYAEAVLKGLWLDLAHSFKIGSDPEIFVEDAKGIVIPAFDFLGAKTSTKNRTVGNYGNKPLYWDGFQAEFETEAINCLGWHTDSVQAGLKGLYDAAKKHNKDAKISSKVVMDIPTEMLHKAKPEHVAFGCMPSKNAYGLEGHKKDGRDVPFRPAGGHIHFGIGKKTDEEYTKIVKALDATIGVACVSLFAKFDDPRRRLLYGLPGEYRTPPHGLEYRTLSNAWLFHPMMMNLVFDIARKGLIFGEKNLIGYWKTSEKEVVDIIQKSDVKAARESLKKNEFLFRQLIGAAYGNEERTTKTVFDIFMNGMESVIKDPTNIEANWMLAGGWVNHAGGPYKNVGATLDLAARGGKV